MHLEPEPDPGALSHCGLLAPVRDDLLAPLPLEQLAVFGRPRARDPVWVRRRFRIPRTPAEEVNPVDGEPTREFHGAQERFVARTGKVATRVERIAVAGQRADLESP
jgi:hypothetical protein